MEWNRQVKSIVPDLVIRCVGTVRRDKVVRHDGRCDCRMFLADVQPSRRGLLLKSMNLRSEPSSLMVLEPEGVC